MIDAITQHIGAIRSTAKGSPNLTSYLFDKELNLITAEGALVTKLGQEHFKPGKYILDAIPPEFGEAFIKNCIIAVNGKNIIQERHIGDDYFVETFIPMPLTDTEFNVMVVARNLSDLKLFKSMKESKEQVEEILSAVSDVFFKTSGDGTILFVNRSCEKVFGFTQDELKGTKISSLYVNPAERESFLAELKATGKTTGFILKMKTKNGGIITTSVSSTLKRSDENEEYLYCTISDITEQVLAKEKLNERNQLFKNLYNYSSMPIVFAHPDGKLSMVNQKFCDFLGYTEKELLNLNYTEFSYHEELARERQYHIEMLENKRDFYDIEKRYLTKKGAVKWGKATISCVRKEDGSVDYIMGVIADIDESKKRTLELKTSEKKFKNIFHNNGLAIYIVNTDGEITMCNEGMQQLLGYKNGELIGKPVSQITYPEDIRKMVECIDDLLSGTESITLKKRYVHKTGDIIIGEITLSLFNAPDENETQIIGIVKDITEQAKAEKALKSSEEKFRKIFENNAIGIATAGIDGSYNLCNEGFCNILGYSKEELYQLKSIDITHPDDVNITSQFIKDIFSGKIKNYHAIKRYITKSGKVIWGEISVSAFNNSENGELTLVGVLHDITDQKNAELALKESEEKFRKIFENNGLGVAIVNKKGEYQLINKGAERILGFTNEEMRGKTNLDITHPDDLNITNSQFKKLIAGKIEQYDLKKRYITKSKKIIWGDITVSLMKISGQEEPMLIGVMHDITEKKHAEEQLKITNKELQNLSDELLEQNSQLENFAHITSHNLRGPLTNLIMVNDVYHKTDSIEVKKQLAVKFGEESRRMLQTLDVLAEQLHIRKKASVVKESLPFKKIFNETINSLSELIETSKAEITADFTECISIYYSKPYLDSIFLNLISNAIKYRSKDRLPLIKIRTYKKGEHKYLEIRDNGIGIDLDRNKSKLFGLYKTFHNHPEARGVGLFLIKNQIESLGGTIDVKSEPDKGTTFIIQF